MFEQLEAFHIEHTAAIRALIAGSMISASCGIVGCFVILRRMSFLADALAHSMLAGVVAGYLILKFVLGADAQTLVLVLGAMIAGFLTVGMIGFVTKVSRIKQDTATGIMYTGIFALGGFVASIPYVNRRIDIDLYHFVVGSVLSVSDARLWMVTMVMVVVVACVTLFYRHLQLTSFDPIMAASIGIPVLLVEFLLTGCTSLVVVSGVHIVGVILVVALMITPAATAYLFFDRLPPMIMASAFIGVADFWVGYYIAEIFGTSPGPAIVLLSTFAFLACLVLAPRYGILADVIRRSQAVPQQLKEDILGSILRSGAAVPMSNIVSIVAGRKYNIRRAVRMLERQDLVEVAGNTISLTEDGSVEATRLVRAHRLWETYLQRVGMPNEELHEKAHILEHMHDPKTVEYLDDRLGHPLVDPHGSEIPESIDVIQGDRPIRASLVRPGRRGTIHSLQLSVNVEMPADIHRSIGKDVTALQRRHGGEVWVFALDDGTEIELNHDQADAVDVQLLPKQESPNAQ